MIWNPKLFFLSMGWLGIVGDEHMNEQTDDEEVWCMYVAEGGGRETADSLACLLNSMLNFNVAIKVEMTLFVRYVEDFGG